MSNIGVPISKEKRQGVSGFNNTKLHLFLDSKGLKSSHQQLFWLFCRLGGQSLQTFSLWHTEVWHQKSRISYPKTSPSELEVGLNVSWDVQLYFTAVHTKLKRLENKTKSKYPPPSTSSFPFKIKFLTNIKNCLQQLRKNNYKLCFRLHLWEVCRSRRNLHRDIYSTLTILAEPFFKGKYFPPPRRHNWLIV